MAIKYTKHYYIMHSDTDSLCHEMLTLDEKPWYIPRETRLLLIQRAGNCCRICKRQFPTETLHIDHVLAVAEGGKAYLNNLQVLCRTCNLQKSSHWIDPESYAVGYVKPIYVETQRVLNNRLLDKVYDPYG